MKVIAVAETWLDGKILNFFFEWIAKVRVRPCSLFSFLVGPRTYQHPGINEYAKSSLADRSLYDGRRRYIFLPYGPAALLFITI